MPQSADAAGKPTAAPTRKVLSAAVVGAIVTVVVWVLNHFVLKSSDQIDGTLSSALTTIATFIAGYFTPPGQNESIV